MAGLREQFSKWKNVRIVKFEKDYQTASGKVIYKRNSTHHIHKAVVEQLGLDKIASVKPYDYEQAMQRAAAKSAKAKKAAQDAA